MAYTRRGFSGSAKQTSLSGDINDAVTTITGADLSTWAGLTTNGPGTATINETQSDEEVILFTGISGNDLTGVTRGAAGTTAQSHSGGATLNHTSSKTDFDEANAHIADTSLDHHSQYVLVSGTRAMTGALKAKNADNYFGTYADGTGTGVSRVRLGTDANNAFVIAEGDGANRNLINRTKGSGLFKVQKDDATDLLQVDTNGGVAMMAGSLPTNTTVGFFYARYMNGTPSGTPASVPGGSVPLAYDISANKLWAYNGGWKSVALS